MKNYRLKSDSGSWKIAFGDLMVCLMCTFLVLWVLQVTDKEEREIIASALNPNKKTQPLAYFDQLDSINPVQLMQNSKDYKTDNYDIRNTSLIKGEYNSQPELELLVKKIESSIQSIYGSENVFIAIIPDGIRISLHDHNTKQRMFARGSANLTYYYEDFLIAFSPIFKGLDNSIVFAGHTDSVNYMIKSSRSNWELSSERANTVRNIMVNNGLKGRNVLQVVGLASTQPFDKKNISSSVNRRVEFIILTKKSAERLRMIFNPSNMITSDLNVSQETQIKIERKKIDAEKVAIQNQPVSRLEAIK